MHDATEVFIVYGRNTQAHEALKSFLRALELRPLEFDEVRNEIAGSPFVGDVIKAGMDRAQAIAVLLTPDEFSSLRPSLRGAADEAEEMERWQARPNVLLEAGMALAIDVNRTLLLTMGRSEIPSDLRGRHLIRLSNGHAARVRLRNALEGVGCKLGRTNSDWLDPRLGGDFEAAISALPEVGAAASFRPGP
jgi:predicted nucleotide-binding protein